MIFNHSTIPSERRRPVSDLRFLWAGGQELEQELAARWPFSKGRRIEHNLTLKAARWIRSRTLFAPHSVKPSSRSNMQGIKRKFNYRVRKWTSKRPTRRGGYARNQTGGSAVHHRNFATTKRSCATQGKERSTWVQAIKIGDVRLSACPRSSSRNWTISSAVRLPITYVAEWERLDRISAG